jgi:hypothetical protein
MCATYSNVGTRRRHRRVDRLVITYYYTIIIIIIMVICNIMVYARFFLSAII